jgi:hypothetical protein
MELKSPSITIDTNKLSDVDALLAESCENLYQLFNKYDRQLFVSAQINIGTDQNVSTFFNVRKSRLQTEEKRKQEMEKLFSLVNGSIYGVSSGRLIISNVSQQ